MPEGFSTPSCCSLRLRSSPTAEGATRVGRIEVTGAADGRGRGERVARAIANSRWSRRALFGRDPNWGRIAQAAGMALAGEECGRNRRRRDRRDRARLAGRGGGDPRSGAAAERPALTSTFQISPTTTSGSTRSNDMTASVETLLEALPYIREFHGKTVVIKYGGRGDGGRGAARRLRTDVVLLKYVGLNPVIVHGGGPEITSYMERLGMEVRFIEGVRSRLRRRSRWRRWSCSGRSTPTS